jgi:hypothetical protein
MGMKTVFLTFKGGKKLTFLNVLRIYIYPNGKNDIIRKIFIQLNLFDDYDKLTYYRYFYEKPLKIDIE